MNRKLHGFTLIEIAVVTAIIGILAMIVTPAFVEVLEAKRIEAEKASFASFEEDIKRSFQDSDWSRNIAAFASAMPSALATQYATNFGSCPVGTLANDSAWYVKLGRMRGIAPDLGAPITADQQKSLFDLAYNGCGQPRLLIAGPSETNQQRYLLISLMAPASKGLVIPTNDGTTAWFDAIWNNNWENEGGSIPTDWTSPSRLSSTEITNWMTGRGTTTNCHLLVVKRILQPKYTITVNNTHPTYYGWVDANGRTDEITSVSGSGPSPAAPATYYALAGSSVVFRRGLLSSYPGTEAYRIHINDNTTFMVQP